MQIKCKRESAYLVGQSKSGYVTKGKLCKSWGVVKGSSKPEAAHCQNRYPSPNEWSDHTRVRPLTPFVWKIGRKCAGFGLMCVHSLSSIVVVGESFPCDSSSKVAHHLSSGVKTSGVQICSALSKFLAFWASWQPYRLVRELASNAHPWVRSAALWQQRFLTPTWPAARLLAAWLVRLATKPVFAQTKRPDFTTIGAVREMIPGSPFAFAGTV